MINFALQFLPSDFKITKDLTLHLESSNAWVIKENDYILIPLNIYLQSKNFSFAASNPDDFPGFDKNSSDHHQIEALLSQFLINDLLHIVHNYGFIDIQIPELLT